jgi:hypothetical protein
MVTSRLVMRIPEGWPTGVGCDGEESAMYRPTFVGVVLGAMAGLVAMACGSVAGPGQAASQAAAVMAVSIRQPLQPVG